MEKRSILTFEGNEEIWPVVEEWAQESRFRQLQDLDNGRLYRKGTGLMTAPIMLQITIEGGKVTMESWINCGLFIRLSVLFMIPAEMAIKSGGFRLVVPRSIARKAVNKLLSRLEQPLIQ